MTDDDRQEQLAALYVELAALDTRLAVEDNDYTINRAGSEPVPEDHQIDAHEFKEEKAEQQRGPEELHEQRQALVERIDALRLE